MTTNTLAPVPTAENLTFLRDYPRDQLCRPSQALLFHAVLDWELGKVGPHNHAELDNCERLYQNAPADLQPKIAPIVEEWRKNVYADYGRPEDQAKRYAKHLRAVFGSAEAALKTVQEKSEEADLLRKELEALIPEGPVEEAEWLIRVQSVEVTTRTYSVHADTPRNAAKTLVKQLKEDNAELEDEETETMDKMLDIKGV